jgi:hypothetical protein
MTNQPSWPESEFVDVDVVPWLPVEPVRTGFGGVVYWRSRDHVNGRYRWVVAPSAMPTRDEPR